MSKQNRFSNPAPTANVWSRRSLFALPLLLIAPVVLGQSRLLDAPRISGAVGERFDGFAMVRDPAMAASLGAVVDSVNAERRKVYAERAKTESVALDQVGRIYAAEIFKTAPAGTGFLQETGQWTRK